MNITRMNERFAELSTKGFGTMWMFYVFALYGLLPIIPAMRPFQDTILYWSNFVQLISLPLLLVGTNILGRDAETRAQYDHEKLAKSYEEQIVIYQDIVAMMARQEEMIGELEGLSCHPRRLAAASPALVEIVKVEPKKTASKPAKKAQ